MGLGLKIAMTCLRSIRTFGRVLAVGLPVVCCALFIAASAFVYAADSGPATQKARKASLRNAGKRWNFQTPDKRLRNDHRHKALNAALRMTFLAPFAPGAHSSLHDGAVGDSGLPGAQREEADTTHPQDNRQIMLGGNAFISGEFSRERTGWRPYNDDEQAGLAFALKEEGRAGLYAGFHPDEAVELKLGPEYYLGSSVTRPDQTGYVKDGAGVLGLGMKLKIDF